MCVKHFPEDIQRDGIKDEAYSTTTQCDNVSLFFISSGGSRTLEMGSVLVVDKHSM